MLPDIPKLSESLRPFALGIGALCREWTELEERVISNLLTLAQMPEDQTSYYILRCFDFRQHLTALKVAAVERFERQECTDAYLETIDYIDNVLRLRRNSYVHDTLYPSVDGEPVQSMKMRVRIVQPQSRQPRQTQFGPLVDLSLDDLLKTIEEVRHHGLYLNAILSYHGHPDWSPKEMLATPPQQRFRNLPPGKPHP